MYVKLLSVLSVLFKTDALGGWVKEGFLRKL